MSMNFYDEINVNELGIKSRSKKEIYDLISQEGDIYLPPIKDAHSDYLSQIICGDKRYLKCKEVKVCSVPHLKGLRTEEILLKSRDWFGIDDFLPEYEYSKLPNRQFLCNIVNTEAEENFKKYIGDCIEARVKHVVLKKQMNIKALPEFIQIFQKSKNLSVQKGRSHFLLKKYGTRKWGEYQPTKEELLRREKKEVERLNKFIKNYEEKLQEKIMVEDELSKKNTILGKLYDSSVIDKDGNPI